MLMVACSIVMSRPFTLLLVGDTISAAGSQITLIALPLTALLLLRSSPWQIGVLTGSAAVPGVFIGLIAGVITDRIAKRRILLMTYAGSALALAMIPLAHAFGWMSFALLLGINFTAGGLTTIRGNTLMATIPALVTPEGLKEANGRYAALLSAATIAGPALAGGLIALSSAPGAIAADALSYAIAAAMMLGLPPLHPVKPETGPTSFWKQLTVGFKVAFGDRLIRKIILVGTGLVFLGAAAMAMMPLFVVRLLNVKPAWYGLGLAAGGAGALLGAITARHVVRGVPLDKLLALILAVVALDFLGISQLDGAPRNVAFIFGLLMLVGSFVSALINVTFTSYLQERSGPELIGRVYGVLSTMFGVSRPLGAVAGGFAASVTGLRPTLLVIAFSYAALIIPLILGGGSSLHLFDCRGKDQGGQSGKS